MESINHARSLADMLASGMNAKALIAIHEAGSPIDHAVLRQVLMDLVVKLQAIGQDNRMNSQGIVLPKDIAERAQQLHDALECANLTYTLDAVVFDLAAHCIAFVEAIPSN